MYYSYYTVKNLYFWTEIKSIANLWILKFSIKN